MNAIELNIMKGLVSILNEASDRYYNSGDPIMTDEQFDARLNDLKQLEEETGFVFANSPTQNVGYKVLTELKEVTHFRPMLSLEKCHTVDELVKFANDKELIASIKLDGLTCRLTYSDGVLARAETRGNGYVGSDITEHVKQFKNVPLKINKEGTYVIDGEAIITDSDFAEINKDGEYKNSRNLASGTLAVLDTSLVAKRRLSLLAWDVIEGGGNSLNDNLSEASELGFDVVPHWFSATLKPEKISGTIAYIFDFAEEEGFPCDGIVFKFNDVEYGKSLGATSHHFRNGIAYKAKDEVYETRVRDIEYTVGKTGVLTPTVVFEPVEIDGTTVERASVHNMSILSKLDLRFGDVIEVYKANMIIPQVKRNVSSDKRAALKEDAGCLSFPEHCPVCGGEIKLVTENSSTVLVCANDNCKGKLLGKLTHFVSKNAMNVDGMSESTIEKFIKLGWLTCFEDIYSLKYHFSEMIGLDGFGIISAKKLLDAISTSKNTTLDRFIYALSIPLIGRSASKTISKYFDGDFNRFCKGCCLNKFDFTVLDDFGEAMNDSINDYIDKNVVMIGNLAKEMEFEKPNQTVSNSNSLNGKVFCITGSLSHFANRDEAKEKIEAAGGKVSGSVSAKTSYLVNNDVASTSGKNKKAKELNIPIISEEELINMLN
jgi:DNA ligase (NAD+)